MLPHQFRKFIDSLRALTDALRETKDHTKNQEPAKCNASEATSEEIRKVPGIIADAIRLAHEDVPAFEKTQRDKEYSQQRKILMATWATFGATFLAFAAAGIYACVANRQLDEMRKAGVQAERQMKLDKRAWITADSKAVRCEPSQTLSGGAVFVTPYVNSGKSPALGVHSWINRTASLSDIGERDPITKSTYMVLGPNDTGNTSTADIPISGEDVRHIRSGQLRVYIYGTIAYSDIFGNDHWTQFCFYPGTNLKSFGPCPKHNTTDDEQHKR